MNRICRKSVSVFAQPAGTVSWKRQNLLFDARCVILQFPFAQLCQSLQSLHIIVHGLSYTREKDEIIQSRLISFHTGIHKRRFVQERQSLYLFKRIENYTISPKVLSSERKQFSYTLVSPQKIRFSKLGS